MNAPIKVFVYGTLKPGGHYWPQFCEGKVLTQTPAKIHGELYDLHVGYPGLILRGEAWVLGYLLEFSEEAHLDRLDELEGYAPGRAESQNEYNRVKVACFDLEGASLSEVWAYEMTVATTERHKGSLIESGDWPVGSA
jgi:gamma-glutamylcyclotransferase (GGCT)/AIG2-like uncharacterized protein YtfP